MALRVMDGEEQCPRCLQAYALEFERRCAECDDALCSLCAIRIEAEWWCAQCKEASDGRARNVEG